jgi:hypothetical protein
VTSTAEVLDQWPVCLREEVPHAEYHKRELGVASKTALDEIERSAAHYRVWVAGRDKPTPARVFGAAFHCALLEPEKFGRTYATEPDFGDCRFKANKAARDEWRMQHAGAVLIPSDDMVAILGMVSSVRRHPIAGRMVHNGMPELTCTWVDSDTGIRCKCRADYFIRRHRMVVDVKSTLDAREKAFRVDSAAYRYHVQDAFYRQGFEAVGEPIDHFALIAVEKEEPFAVAVWELDAGDVAKGLEHARRNLDTLAHCLELDEWPAYSQSIRTLKLPPWA